MKAGESNEYKGSIVLRTAGTEISISYKSTEKVLELKSDGSYIVASTASDQRVTVAGQAQPSGPEETTKFTYSKTGEVVAVESARNDPNSLGTRNLLAMIWPTRPVDVGSKWEAETKSGSAIHHSFEVLARESVLGHDTFKIAIVAKETSKDGATASGTTWVDVKNGMTAKTHGEMLNVRSATALLNSISYTLTLVE